MQKKEQKLRREKRQSKESSQIWREEKLKALDQEVKQETEQKTFLCQAAQ